MRYFPVIFLLLFLSGCAGFSSEKAKVETGSPVVYVHPLVPVAAELGRASVAVLPFIVPEGIEVNQGERVALLFQDVLLGKQAFQTVKMVNKHYGTLEEATTLGKETGTDLVLAGRVKYLISGTELGGARVELSVRIIDVQDGKTIWYIEQAMDQKMDYPDVSLGHRLGSVFSTPPVRGSAGAPTVANMLTHIAVDIADVMAGARYVARREKG